MKCPRCGLINPDDAVRCDCGHDFARRLAEQPPSPQGTPPAYSLFDYRAVGLATFLGTPLAGSILMALNYRRLGEKAAAGTMVAGGIVLTGLSILLGYALPSGASATVGIAVLMGVVYGAKALQGAQVEEHTRRGGKLASRWIAFGTGLAVLAPVVLVIVIYATVGNPSKKVVIGTKDQVFYSGDAREEDATALGRALKSHGYFQDKGAAAVVAKAKNLLTVSFVLKDGYWDDPEHVSAYANLGREIAPAIGGLPLNVRLVNSRLEVEKEVTVGPIAFTSYDDAKRGIRIKVPQDWKIQDDDFLVFSGPSGINVRLSVKATAYSLDEYTKRNIEEIRRINQTFHDIFLKDLGEPTPTAVAGIPARAVAYSARTKDVPAKGWQVWTIKNKKAYLVVLSAGEQSFDTYLPVAQEMVASLEIH